MKFRRNKPKVKDWSKWSIPGRVIKTLSKNEIPEQTKDSSRRNPKYCKKLKGKHQPGDWENERKTPWGLWQIQKCIGCGKVLKYNFPSLGKKVQDKKPGQSGDATNPQCYNGWT